MPERRPQPKRADALRNRARLLEAARELVAARGVEVPLDDIARHAGVGPGTLHRNFPSKESLLAAIVFDDLRRRLEEARTRASQADASAALFALLDGLLDDGLANRALKVALSDAGATIDPGAAQEFRDALGPLVAAAQRTGHVRDDIDANDVEALLAGALAAQEHAEAHDARVRRIRTLALSGLRPSGHDA